MNQKKILSLPDVEVLARTIYGEARNQGLDGQTAVANVIMNRVDDPKKRYGDGIVGVCLKPYQFSCWNDRDKNLPIVLDPEPDITISKIVAAMAIRGLLKDVTHGANLYHYIGMEMYPYWSTAEGVTKTTKIGDHVFYRES